MTIQKLTETITVREIKKSDWSNIESLFGTKGACGGCWCMHWRTPQGGKTWLAVQGEPNRMVFQKLVNDGKALGILAFDGKTPVGWCSFGMRADFPRTETVKAYRSSDNSAEQKAVEPVWSINCFYLASGFRNRGVSQMLASAAVTAIKSRRGRIIEAYPVSLTKDGEKLPAAFSFTGGEIIFKRLGFKVAQRLSESRPLYKLTLP